MKIRLTLRSAICAVLSVCITSMIAFADNTSTAGDSATTVRAACPRLSSGVLTFAVAKQLEDDTVVSAGDIQLTLDDIEKITSDIPPAIKEEAKDNLFFIVEQEMARRLILVQAKKRIALDGLSDNELIQKYLDMAIDEVDISDTSTRAFYHENEQVFGGAAYEQVNEQIRSFLMQQEKHKSFLEHMMTMGKRTDIFVSKRWVQEQCKRAKNNPVDKARDSNIPTLVDFGADGCTPCDMMTPVLADLKEKYEGKLNVVFVHVRERQLLAARYGIESIPVQVFYDKDGVEVHRHSGFYPQADIEQKLAEMGVR